MAHLIRLSREGQHYMAQESGSLTKAILRKKIADGWSNVLSGLGIAGRDKRLSSLPHHEFMTEHDIEQWYAGDGMARKIVELPVDEAFAEGYEFVGIDDAQIEKLWRALKDISFDEAVAHAAMKARLYGGSGILKVFDDNLLLDKPLSKDETRPIKSLIVLNKFEIPAYEHDVDKDILSKNFNQPIWYTFTSRSTANQAVNVRIHRSRMVRFDGLYLPDRLFESNNYWGQSVIESAKDAIRDFASTHESAVAALQDFSVGVFKIAHLADALAGGDDNLVTTRLQIANVSKSILRAIVVDAESEDFQYSNRTLTGVMDVVSTAETRLSAETNIPRTVLLGESPKGVLGENSEAQQNNWKAYLTSYQIKKLKPQMMEIVAHVARSIGIDPGPIDLVFNPLEQKNEKEEAETRRINAETDRIYIEQGVYDPSEVRESRFSSGEYRSEIILDPSISLDPIINEKPETFENEENENEF